MGLVVPPPSSRENATFLFLGSISQNLRDDEALICRLWPPSTATLVGHAGIEGPSIFFGPIDGRSGLGLACPWDPLCILGYWIRLTALLPHHADEEEESSSSAPSSPPVGAIRRKFDDEEANDSDVSLCDTVIYDDIVAPTCPQKHKVLTISFFPPSRSLTPGMPPKIPR